MTYEKVKESRVADDRKKHCIYLALKRIFDVSAAYILLMILYVPMLFISISIKMTSRGPIIFKQVRIGERGRPFVCYKFRTMSTDAPPNMSTAEFADAERYITAVGGFLRKTSLDELPQLFNVLGGDMSFVGPRPLIPAEKEVHEKRNELGVYEARPGITGLAQIMGRDMLSDGEKVGYDAKYVSNIRFTSDAKIIFRTVFKVCSADGIKKRGEKNPEGVADIR